MTRKKVASTELARGMYVAELDRPWTDSPFLFQGFTISSGEELDQLRQTCRHVWVEDAPGIDDGDRTIRRSVNARPNANPRQTRSEWMRIADAERRVSFERELNRAAVVRRNTREYVNTLLTDVRFGRAIDTQAAKQVVAEMVESITADPDAALWLTQLKKAHDYTAQHCINVAVLSIAFAAHLGYPRDQLQIIGLGALLHDIGKMRVPPHILDKPGRLTPEEFEVMRRHPADGYELLKATNAIPAQSLQIVRFHHERISGKGYPDGLKGDQLSTAVLITAICDVYDALTSDRAYRSGVTADDGLHAMFVMAPSDFGRSLVQEFIRCVGIYPVGSLVELGTGAVGVVMTKDPQYKLRPVVMLLRDAEGKEYRPRRFISLASQATLDPNRDWSVARIVDPKTCGIDLAQVANDELIGRGHQVVHV